MTAFDVVSVSIRQATVDDRLLGRVSASYHVLAMAAMLVGTAVGGLVAETLGLRAALFVAALGGVRGGPDPVVLGDPRHGRGAGRPAPADRAIIPGEDLPLAE